MTSAQSPTTEVSQKKAGSEIVFKYINIVLVVMLIYCIKGFVGFREVIHDKGLHSVQHQAWLWAVISFIVYGIVKYSYFAIVRPRLLPIIDSKYQGDQRTYRQKQVSKLSFDTIFYSSSTFMGYYLFRDEPWFPKMAGGYGQCQNIYKAFPDWPGNHVNSSLQLFYMVQLGVRAFGVFQSLVIKGPSDRKYYQFLLHHFIATTLIILSLLSNQVAVGAVILVVHDISDITSALSRAVVETKYHNMLIDAILFVITFANWFYMRSIVFPFCIIPQIFNNIPNPQDSWWIIRIEHSYLLLLCTILAGMHLFWCFFLLQFGYRAAFGKPRVNTHDKLKEKE